MFAHAFGLWLAFQISLDWYSNIIGIDYSPFVCIYVSESKSKLLNYIGLI